MHYTSFINENPIPIVDIVQLQNQPVSEMNSAVADKTAESLTDSSSAMQDVENMNGNIQPEVSAANNASSMDDGHHAGVGNMVITEEQINAALQALVEAGENVPEGLFLIGFVSIFSLCTRFSEVVSIAITFLKM